jgi:hypothetical protein
VSSSFTVSSTEDAIALAEITLGANTLAAMVTGRRLAVPVSGAVPADGILHWHAVLLEAIGDQHDTLVLATRRRTGSTFVLERELAWWRSMQSRHRDRALVLADWLVFVRDEVVLSLAELAGPAAVWS